MREVDPCDLPEFCQKPTLVLGVGNILFGDDGFGCAVVDYIESHYQVPENVCLLDVGTGVRKLLFTLCLSSARPQRLLVLDAIDAGRTQGEIFEIDPAEIPAVKLDDFSLHQLPTSNLLRELQESCGVEVRVLACQTGPLPEQIYQGFSKAFRSERFLAASVAHLQPAARVARKLRGRSTCAGLPDGATAGTDLPRFLESHQRRRAASGGVAGARVFSPCHSPTRGAMPMPS